MTPTACLPPADSDLPGVRTGIFKSVRYRQVVLLGSGPLPPFSCYHTWTGETTKKGAPPPPFPLHDMVGFPGFSLLDAPASASLLLLLAGFPSPCGTGVVQQFSTVALECSLRGVGERVRLASELKRRWLPLFLSLVLSAICIPAGQPVSPSVMEGGRKRERESGLLREVKTPVEAGTVTLTVAASPPSSVHPTMPAHAWQAGTVRDRDDAITPVASRAVIGLGGDSKPRSQLGHPDTCGREEQILLPSLLAGPDSPMGWVVVV